MRGKRASIARRKADLLIVSVRYEPDDRRIAIARGYERRGKIWSDLRLFDRQTLVDRLQAGQRVVTGRRAELVGDFDVLSRVRLTDSGQFISADGAGVEKDELGVPLF